MTILDKILAVKRQEVAKRMAECPPEELERKIAQAPQTRSLAAALKRGDADPIRVIAEVKRASPSAGPIRPDADPVDIATGYQEAGASAVSVLTDERFFDGHLTFLEKVRPVLEIPVLRKDFLVDSYQVLEARASGADAVLLIVAALDDATLESLFQKTTALGMEALVEVHSEAEAARAVAVGARVVGVNHRDLRTFEVDTSLTGRLRDCVPSDCVLVGESGIRTAADLEEMRRSGADAVLVGESLMRKPCPGDALRELLAGGPNP